MADSRNTRPPGHKKSSPNTAKNAAHKAAEHKQPVRRDDATLWQAVKDSARPVHRDTVPLVDFSTLMPAKPHTPAEKVAKPKPHILTMSNLPVPRPKPGPRDLAHGCAPGVDKRTAERLRRGKMAIERRLDLHGMSREAAHSRCLNFILDCSAAGNRCVLIVTGKGKGILQSELPRWLNLPPMRECILSFNHATPSDGGSGAVYVLLKRRRDPR